MRAFKLGVLSLQERAKIDQLFDTICNRICELGDSAKIPLPKPLQPETRPHSEMYYVNLSGGLQLGGPGLSRLQHCFIKSESIFHLP